MLKDWKVIYVKANNEKKILTVCQNHGIQCYLPIITRPKIYQRCRRDVKTPLFRGYIFAEVLPEHRVTLLKTNSIVKIIQPFHPIALLRELVCVRRWIRDVPGLDTETTLKKGEKVKVLTGPLMGAEGVVEKVDAKYKIWIYLEMLGQTVTAEVSCKDLIRVTK